MDAIFFASPVELRAWFETNGEAKDELLVGYWKKATGRPSLTWAESVDEALCVGWIDGIRRSLGDDAFTIRFTPRRPRSIWSAVNIRRVAELTAEGRMRPAGLAAFARRSDERSAIYSYEQRHTAELTADELAALDAEPAARAWWDRQPPGWRRQAAWWIRSAKRPETQARRFAQLLEGATTGRRPGQLTAPGRSREGQRPRVG
jgi:uncharacterized protein YdeI (YjbR/CyaY-like superfamily)